MTRIQDNSIVTNTKQDNNKKIPTKTPESYSNENESISNEFQSKVV